MIPFDLSSFLNKFLKMNPLTSNAFLLKQPRVFRLFFIVFALALFLMNAILLNIYHNVFLDTLKSDNLEHTKVQPSLFLSRTPQIKSHFNSSNYILDSDDLSTLLNLTDFKFVLNHPDKCNLSDLFMLIFVHSAAGNFEKRSVIRNTWANTNNLRQSHSQMIFLIGEIFDTHIARKVQEENHLFQDLLQGNFLDTYKNLTYKNIMGLKYISYYCSNVSNVPKFLFKTDDDIFVDLLQLTYYLKGTFGYSPRSLMACYLNRHSWVNRSYRNKWRVSHQEYSDTHYPKYCAGWGVIMSLDVVLDLYRISKTRPYFWIDDIFVFGILSSDLGLLQTDIADRVSIDKVLIDNWLKSEDLTLPPMFGIPDSSPETIYLLWNKTTRYYRSKFNYTIL